MNGNVSGTFDVAITPEASEAVADGTTLARHGLAKRYHGGLEAVARGTMLSVRTNDPGSAVYVATEHVVGTLDGRHGAFALHHRGVMDAGAQSLEVAVVPGSGSGELTGLRGTLAIAIDGREHRYTFTWTLGEGA